MHSKLEFIIMTVEERIIRTTESKGNTRLIRKGLFTQHQQDRCVDALCSHHVAKRRKYHRGLLCTINCEFECTWWERRGEHKGLDSHFLSATGGVEEGEEWAGRWLGLSRREHLWSSSLLPWKRDRRSKKPSSPMVSCDPGYGITTDKNKCTERGCGRQRQSRERWIVKQYNHG